MLHFLSKDQYRAKSMIFPSQSSRIENFNITRNDFMIPERDDFGSVVVILWSGEDWEYIVPVLNNVIFGVVSMSMSSPTYEETIKCFREDCFLKIIEYVLLLFDWRLVRRESVSIKYRLQKVSSCCYKTKSWSTNVLDVPLLFEVDLLSE